MAEPRVIAHRENPFPQDLEGRMNSILNVVNTEFKTLTLLHLDDTLRTGGDIKREVRSTSMGRARLPKTGCFVEYCHCTLYPIGTVAEEEVILDDGETQITGYKLTEGGRKYGRPIAAFSLDYAVKQEMSMFSILSTTSSPGETRAPYNRIKILKALCGQDNFRVADLTGELKLLDSAILRHLKSFQEIGFLTIETCGESTRNIGQVQYCWVGREDTSSIRSVKEGALLTKRVAEKLKELQEADVYQLGRALDFPLPRKVRGYLSSILSGLVEQGFAKRKKWDAFEKSKVSLLNAGRGFLAEYVDRVTDALSDGPALTEMNQTLETLESDKELYAEWASRGINLYRQVSPNINRVDSEVTGAAIVDFLRENPGSRPVEVADSLSSQVVRIYLSRLAATGILRKERVGRATRYYVA